MQESDLFFRFRMKKDKRNLENAHGLRKPIVSRAGVSLAGGSLQQQVLPRSACPACDVIFLLWCLGAPQQAHLPLRPAGGEGEGEGERGGRLVTAISPLS